MLTSRVLQSDDPDLKSTLRGPQFIHKLRSHGMPYVRELEERTSGEQSAETPRALTQMCMNLAGICAASSHPAPTAGNIRTNPYGAILKRMPKPKAAEDL